MIKPKCFSLRNLHFRVINYRVIRTNFLIKLTKIKVFFSAWSKFSRNPNYIFMSHLNRITRTLLYIEVNKTYSYSVTSDSPSRSIIRQHLFGPDGGGWVDCRIIVGEREIKICPRSDPRITSPKHNECSYLVPPSAGCYTGSLITAWYPVSPIPVAGLSGHPIWPARRAYSEHSRWGG